MSVRLPELEVLTVEGALAAAERILAAPTCNTQRVALNETYTFALLTRQYVQLGRLAARHVAGLDPDPAQLVEHLRCAGFLPASSDPASQETTHVR